MSTPSNRQKVRDELLTLAVHGIRVDVPDGWPLPAELNKHVEQVLLAQRTSDTPRSPNASEIVVRRQNFVLRNEDAAINVIEPLLLFCGQNKSAFQGIPKITSDLNINLSQDYLPLELGNIASQLTQPQPDTAIGYLTNFEASQYMPGLESAFSMLDDVFLKGFTLTPTMHFPFLTSQWKSGWGESSMKAECQSACDGSTIVKYLDKFHSVANNRPATAVEGSHVSVTCDMKTISIWIHWKDVDKEGNTIYPMKHLYSAIMRYESQVARARDILHNVLDYATTKRLESIQKALPLFKQHWVKRKGKNTTSNTTPLKPPIRTSVSSPSSGLEISTPSRKSNKRRRTERDDKEYVG
ncbi:hypothetical protein K505DRAFT_235246 [Melanomma pulvis-pyrius CBS 109.77]|uniref:DUF7924 domain-containing protein n=1 Tax=Melanomma pulvis-pyrius CBS 109.77 TaxID=1314802 RepID=A0A6A6XN03_9PLEO|nr:hypothetical protein K505DRAFT_235246 [Melanomma pulvis-pyrius CBS 109.77]